jgi:sulfur-oxidizing protein SoxB
MTYAETYVSEMTGKQIHDMLEGVADNLFDPDPYLQSGGDMVRVGGLDYTIDPSKKLGERITDIVLDDGRKLEPEETYSVSGWATVNRTPEGRLMWDVVRDYILEKKGKDNVLKLPKINHPKLVNVMQNPGISDYPGVAS